eukprot:454689_1
MSALIAMAMCDKQNHFMYKHSHNIIAQIKQYYFTNEKLRLMAQSCVQTLATHCTPNIQIINNNSSQLNDISEDKDEDEDEYKDEEKDEDINGTINEPINKKSNVETDLCCSGCNGKLKKFTFDELQSELEYDTYAICDVCKATYTAATDILSHCTKCDDFDVCEKCIKNGNYNCDNNTPINEATNSNKIKFHVTLQQICKNPTFYDSSITNPGYQAITAALAVLDFESLSQNDLLSNELYIFCEDKNYKETIALLNEKK